MPVWAYDGVAKTLASIIFSSSTLGDANPSEALEALNALTIARQRRPLLMTRLVSVENRSLFLPLGLLSAQGSDRVLSGPVTVVQQMPNQRVTRGEPCIGAWAFAIPSRLDGLPDIGRLNLPEVASNTPWFIGRLSDAATLEHYLNGTTARRPQTGGEGLILLAHHGEGTSGLRRKPNSGWGSSNVLSRQAAWLYCQRVE